MIDSEATHHLISKVTGKYLVEAMTVKHKIKDAVRNGSLYVQYGTTNIKTNDVLECSELEYNLLSEKRLEKEGLKR